MRLTKLFTRSEWDLSQPLRNPQAWPDGFWPHVAAHLGAGPLLYGAALLIGVSPFLGAVFAQAWWQFALEETHSTIGGGQLPVWSMVWDIAGTAVGAGATWGVIRLAHG